MENSNYSCTGYKALLIPLSFYTRCWHKAELRGSKSTPVTFADSKDGCPSYLCCFPPLCCWYESLGRTLSLSVKTGEGFSDSLLEKIKTVLFWSTPRCRCTLSAPSVLRVLFMISSRRWLRERNEWGIGKYHSCQIWYASSGGKLSEFCLEILKNGII